MSRQERSSTSVFKLVIFVTLGFIALIASFRIIEMNDANQIMVIQNPLSGKLTWYTDAGIKGQWFGRVTKYPKREIYEFKTPVRFNDGGHGTMLGSVSYELPLDPKNLTNIHVKFGCLKALESQLIATVVNKAIYMTGPLMSSKESYAEKRNYLIQYVEDQIQNGVYRTVSREAKTVDQMTGAEKTVTVVEICMKGGIPERQEDPAMVSFGISTFNFAINELPYDAAVETQIKQQQQIAMDVQTAIASAKKAEQNAITTAKEGEANAMKAKWDQEVIRAREVTQAEQVRDVAKLNKEAAEFKKQENILLGQGEAERKRLVMNADGALDKKLDAWKEVNFKYAEMIKGSQLVPSVVMGGEGKTASANEWIQLFMAKTAKDLALDMSVPQGGK